MAQTQTSDYVSLLRRSIEPQAFIAGTAVFNEGDEATHMYVVDTGTVEIRKHGRVLESLGTNRIFGELALIDVDLRSADAIAVTDVELIPIEKRRFWFLIQETPYFAQAVMKEMAARIKRHDDDD